MRDEYGDVPRLRLGLLLWAAGFAGVVALSVLVIPAFVQRAAESGEAVPLPLWAIVALGIVQSGILLALMVWCGVAFAPRVNLHAPAFEAAVTVRSVGAAMRSQWMPGAVGAVMGFGFFLIAGQLQPEGIPASGLPLAARVLYGGITEELLLRWGLMSLLLWLAWRLIQRGEGVPRAALAWLAIVLSALLFALGHLPAASLQVAALTPAIVSYIVIANSAFGLVFGFLFWRYGLEAAMIAHAGAHVLNFIFVG